MGAEQLDAADSLQSRLIMALAMAQFRKERDLLGEREVPAEALHGVHTERAIENFPLSGRRVHPELIHLPEQFDALTSAEAVTKLGSAPRRGEKRTRPEQG